ncbi:MAG: ferritin-like domain-containing protein [Firmicutes bacterium]|nr:ferritin-like domain-containing protein [Bacillota bacterium]
MIRIHPDLTDDELLRLFDKGIRAQWTQDAIDWSGAASIPEAKRRALADVITPVYLGEQTAMVGISTVLPMVLNRGMAEAGLYLSSMGLDEARHFHNLHQLYDLLGQEPLPRRRLPEMFRYHARLLARREPTEWVWGILISDLFAKRFYGGFVERFPDTLVGRLSARTLQDEARHQAFSDRYLTRMLPTMTPEGRQALLDMRDDLFRVIEVLGGRLRPAMDELEWSPEEFIAGLWADTERWARRLHVKPGEAVEAPEPEA